VKYTPTIVLGIDQAKASGWAIATPGGRVLQHGLAKHHGEREDALHEALRYAHHAADDLLVVFEDHGAISLSYGGRKRADGQDQAPKRNAAMLLGLGAARGRWDELLDGIGHPEVLRLKVTPRDWRARVLGVGQSIGTDALKRRAVEWATRHVGREVTDHNEAEGICICAWGAIDGVAVLAHQRKATRMVSRVKRAAQKQLALEEGS